MALYSIDVRVYGTLYVTASTKAEARKLAIAQQGNFLMLSGNTGDARIRWSPAATAYKPDARAPMEIVDEDEGLAWFEEG